jgi:hypothetical protein
MPTTTRYSGLSERISFLAYAGCSLRALAGSATRSLSAATIFSISGVRRTTHTGLPRHSTIIFWPGSSALMSTSTGAPAAFARSEGSMLATNGTAAAPAATPAVATVVAVRRKRRFP